MIRLAGLLLSVIITLGLNAQITQVPAAGGGGGTWGTITGDITSQSDLNIALGLKAPVNSPSFTGVVSGSVGIRLYDPTSSLGSEQLLHGNFPAATPNWDSDGTGFVINTGSATYTHGSGVGEAYCGGADCDELFQTAPTTFLAGVTYKFSYTTSALSGAGNLSCALSMFTAVGPTATSTPLSVPLVITNGAHNIDFTYNGEGYFDVVCHSTGASTVNFSAFSVKPYTVIGWLAVDAIYGGNSTFVSVSAGPYSSIFWADSSTGQNTEQPLSSEYVVNAGDTVTYINGFKTTTYLRGTAGHAYLSSFYLEVPDNGVVTNFIYGHRATIGILGGEVQGTFEGDLSIAAFWSGIAVNGPSTVAGGIAGYYVQSTPGGFEGAVTAEYGVWIGSLRGGAANYPLWIQEAGVLRIRADNTYDSVYQGIMALYNPLFTLYTPDAPNYERIVMGQWNGNVAEIGTQKGGTGTLRRIRIIGTSVQLPIVHFADLGSPVNAVEGYCDTCTVTSGVDNTCAGSGSGAHYKGIAGAWKCEI